MDKKLEIRNLIASKGLKVTPQRASILEAVNNLNHPSVENILNYIWKNDPNIGSGTVYKVLETLVENNLIKKIKTKKNIMRYDGILKNHHHLYCIKCDYIEDYNNEKLDKLLADFFKENKIYNFKIEDIKVSITGNFIKHKTN